MSCTGIYLVVFSTMLIYCGVNHKEQPMIIFIIVLTCLILGSVLVVAGILIKRLRVTNPDMLHTARVRIGTACVAMMLALSLTLSYLISNIESSSDYSQWKHS